jgi:hypothetical protein
VETLVIHGFLHLCGHDHEKDKGEMMELQSQLERELLEAEPLPMALKRGRKAGSKVKKLRDGSRVVVTGRAAAALSRKASEKEAKLRARKKKAVKSSDAPKRGPGRPRKDAAAAGPAAPRRIVRRRIPLFRSPVIA